MSKLSFDALSQRADAIAKEELLISINGGTQNCCHPGDCPPPPPPKDERLDAVVICDRI